MAKVSDKDMSFSRCIKMSDPVICAEKYLSCYMQRQAAKGVAVDSREFKQLFHSAVCHRQGLESCPVMASCGWL